MADNKQITVQGVAVEVSQPYAAGHAITEAEAKALNQVRAENIGNNLRKQIKDMLEANGGDTDGVQKEAQAAVSEYDKTYEFTMASVGGGSTARLDPLTKECRAIARDHIKAKLAEMGVTQKAYLEANGPEAIKEKVIEISDHPKIVEAAKKALKERQKMDDIELSV